MSISGFTIVRNAKRLDYPFPENVLSILPLCDEFIINCGDSEDGTLAACEQLRDLYPGKVKIIQSVWERSAQSGGFQLRHQTDAALKECRGDWCFYIQADEVVSEQDHGAILENIRRADKMPEVDGLAFEYLHFYGDYRHFQVGRHWYRREVRLFKNHRKIQAFRDAQGFRIDGQRLKAIPAGATVYHYGHVRSGDSLHTKNREMVQWWGEAPAENPLHLRRSVGLRKFNGQHPRVMKGRIEAFDETLINLEACPRKYDWDELKDLITLSWEKIVHYRLGEFRNYDLV